MRGLLIFLGLLLLLGGGAVAGAQYAPIDLSTLQFLDNVPGAREFLTTPMALYAGGGAAAFGFLLAVVAGAAGGKKELKVKNVIKPPTMARDPAPRPKPAVTPRPVAPSVPPPAPAPKPAASKPPPIAPAAPQPAPAEPPKPQPAPQPQPIAASAPQPAPQPAAPMPRPAAPKPAPQPAAAVAPKPAPKPAPQPAAAVAPKPAPKPAPQPAAAAAPAAAPPQPRPVAPSPAPAEPPKAKPQASAQPPAAATGAPPPDPRMLNRKRVQDLVTVNDAVKAYHAKNGAYPKADGLAGATERGATWIPGLTPDFLKDLPRDPLHNGATQYVYVSDGANYKLLAQGVSLAGGANVEVLGIKIDPTRNPTPQNAAFGFWTPAFAGA